MRHAQLGRRAVLGAMALSLAGCMSSDDDEEGVDASGEIEIRIDGEPLDLSQDRYQAEYSDEYSLAFHLHEDSDLWWSEGEEPVTILEGLHLLPEFSVARHDDGFVLTIDGTSYDTREGDVTIETTVDGEAVDPATYELEDGDDLVVRIETDA